MPAALTLVFLLSWPEGKHTNTSDLSHMTNKLIWTIVLYHWWRPVYSSLKENCSYTLENYRKEGVVPVRLHHSRVKTHKSHNIVLNSHLSKCGRNTHFDSYCYKGMCNPSHSDVWSYAFNFYVAYLTIIITIWNIFLKLFSMNWKLFFPVLI